MILTNFDSSYYFYKTVGVFLDLAVPCYEYNTYTLAGTSALSCGGGATMSSPPTGVMSTTSLRRDKEKMI